jgi:hypothetical protein
MLVAIVEFPKVKREARMRRVLTNIRQGQNPQGDKVVKIKLVPFLAGKVKR